MDQDINIYTNGPIHYIRMPLTYQNELMVIHLFSDCHDNINQSSMNSMYLHELVDQTLSHYQETHSDMTIDIMAEYGFGRIQSHHVKEELYRNNNMPIFLFENYFLSKGCFIRPVHETAKSNYPNARFHNADFRYTLLYNLQSVIRIGGEDTIHPLLDKTYETIKPYLQLDKLPKDKIDKTLDLIREQDIVLNDEIMLLVVNALRATFNRDTFLKSELQLLKNALDSYPVAMQVNATRSLEPEFKNLNQLINDMYLLDWVHYMMSSFDQHIKPECDRLNCNLTVSDLDNMSFHNRSKCLILFFTFYYDFVQTNLFNLNTLTVVSLHKTNYIKYRLDRMFLKVVPYVRTTLFDIFNTMWTNLIQKVDSFDSVYVSDFRRLIINFYIVCRLFKKGTTHSILYFGAQHIIDIITLISMLDLFDTKEIIPYKNQLNEQMDKRSYSQCQMLNVKRDTRDRVYLPFDTKSSTSKSILLLSENSILNKTNILIPSFKINFTHDIQSDRLTRLKRLFILPENSKKATCFLGKVLDTYKHFINEPECRDEMVYVIAKHHWFNRLVSLPVLRDIADHTPLSLIKLDTYMIKIMKDLSEGFALEWYDAFYDTVHDLIQTTAKNAGINISETTPSYWKLIVLKTFRKNVLRQKIDDYFDKNKVFDLSTDYDSLVQSINKYLSVFQEVMKYELINEMRMKLNSLFYKK
jgi:hypothetical protein